VWGLAEGSNTITSDAESASYAGLDIAAKVIFGWALMLSSGIIHEVQAEEAKRWAPSLSPMSYMEVVLQMEICAFLLPVFKYRCTCNRSCVGSGVQENIRNEQKDRVVRLDFDGLWNLQDGKGRDRA